MMSDVEAVMVTARCILAVVFFVAAVGKLLDLAGSRRALEGFGLPTRLGRLAAVALPGTELVVVAFLLIEPTALLGAASALALMLIFMAGIAHAMSKDEAPDCHCFGQLHSEPAGRSTLMRNAVLAAVSVLILTEGAGPSLDAWLGSLSASEGALVGVSAAAALLAAATGQLWEDKRRLKRELAQAKAASAVPGLPRGTPAPEFALTPVRGTASSLSELLESGRRPVLVFLSTHCNPCLHMLPTLARWQASLSETLVLTAMFSGELAEIERLCNEHGLNSALAQENNEIFALYLLRATPSAVLIEADGTLAGAPAEGVPAIEALVRSVLARSASPPLLLHSG